MHTPPRRAAIPQRGREASRVTTGRVSYDKNFPIMKSVVPFPEEAMFGAPKVNRTSKPIRELDARPAKPTGPGGGRKR